MTTVEITRFRVPAERTDALLAARPGMLRDFQADRAGFLGARLIQLPADEWLDIVFWGSSEDYAESRRRGANLPGIQTFFSLIESVISMEEGTTTDPDQP
ncbi:hypothetical protein ABTW72_04380 [Micromonospora sp. NPDC127501]|uniref:hypothetical protein n=1 Tax=Micromonospora sp. NPDC127501 TaxID=3154872 RepID=UPI00331F3251